VETAGKITLAPGISKDLVSSPVDGAQRVIIFAMNQSEFEGLFAIVNSSVGAISGVVGAKADATNAFAVVGKLSQPQKPNITISYN
jgi:hypothetical protein